MTETVISFLEKIDINNPITIFIIAFLLIILTSSYMRAFAASKVESVLMSEKNGNKRDNMNAVILVIIFIIANVLLGFEIEFIVCLIVLFILGNIYLFIRKKWGKENASQNHLFAKLTEDDFKVNRLILNMLTIGPILAFVFSLIWIPYSTKTTTVSYEMIQANKPVFVSFAIILSVLESFILINMKVLDENKNIEFFIEADGVNWYIYSRDENTFLCGNEKNKEEATECTYISIQKIEEKGYHIKKK